MNWINVLNQYLVSLFKHGVEIMCKIEEVLAHIYSTLHDYSVIEYTKMC